MNKLQKQYILQQVVSAAIGQTASYLLDKKLAKSENPGLLNRMYRKAHKITTHPLYLAASIGLNAYLIYEMRDKKPTEPQFSLFYSLVGGGALKELTGTYVECINKREQGIADSVRTIGADYEFWAQSYYIKPVNNAS